MSLELTSTAFKTGDPLPREFTADGRDISPPLKWSEPPSGTRSLALICEDPDAPRGIFTHWVVYHIPPESPELIENIPRGAVRLPNGTLQGTNDFGKVGYGGPAPPPGKPHRYYFKIFALDQQVNLGPGASRKQLLEAMKDHVLAEGKLMGRYGKKG